MEAAWPAFAERRRQRLERGLFEAPAEQIAEQVLESLFTRVLDWPMPDVHFQVGQADMVLSALGIKKLVVEVKRPDALLGRRRAIDAAISQACGYAERQKVAAIAISDGTLLYAADRVGTVLRGRVAVTLDTEQPPTALWWISVRGIVRSGPIVDLDQVALREALGVAPDDEEGATLLHPRYGLPAKCFAYVGAVTNPRTWKLPYRLATGAPDGRRLTMAIQASVRDYRGTQVRIPRDAMPDVLVHLGRAAGDLRRLPCQVPNAGPAYRALHDALEQVGRIADVGCCTAPVAGNG